MQEAATSIIAHQNIELAVRPKSQHATVVIAAQLLIRIGLKGAQLEVTVTGSSIVLAGSDEEGDSMTVRGTVDSTGTLLKASYILNGSASGRCETDDGAGSLAKR